MKFSIIANGNEIRSGITVTNIVHFSIFGKILSPAPPSL